MFTLFCYQVLSKSASVRGFLMNHYANLWPAHLKKLVTMYEKGEISSAVDNGKFSPKGPFRGVDSVPDAVDVSNMLFTHILFRRNRIDGSR